MCCTGAITQDCLETLREADAIVREEIEKLPVTPWQYFAVISNLKSTDIKNGKRYMGWPVIIGTVETIDAVTAHSVMLPQETLVAICNRILNEVDGVNCVLWDFTDKPVVPSSGSDPSWNFVAEGCSRSAGNPR